MSIRCWKKKVIPDRTDAKIEAAKTKCVVLYREYRDRKWILDDESYFPLSHSTINGNYNFYSENKDLAPADVKFSKKKNLNQNYLSGLPCRQVGFLSH